MPMSVLKQGDFVRVKDDSDFRAGQDGMVVSPDDGQAVGLVFGYDRYNQSPATTGVVTTGLIEEWALTELDLSSRDR